MSLSRRRFYFSDEVILVKVPVNLLPVPLTAAMTARAMPEAIKPYSIAVAPDSSVRNLLIVFMPAVMTETSKGGVKA